MRVYVICLNGRGVMPTTERKARVLLSRGRAETVGKVPFTIRFLYKTGCAPRWRKGSAPADKEDIPPGQEVQESPVPPSECQASHGKGLCRRARQKERAHGPLEESAYRVYIQPGKKMAPAVHPVKGGYAYVPYKKGHMGGVQGGTVLRIEAARFDIARSSTRRARCTTMRT